MINVQQMDLGVDSGQMAVLARDYANSGFAGHLGTFARAGQRFKVFTFTESGRAKAFVVLDSDSDTDAALAPFAAFMSLYGWQVNVLGDLGPFESKTPLVVCDPCYALDVGVGDPLYDTVCALPSAGGMVVDGDAVVGASCGTGGDGVYRLSYVENTDGSLMGAWVLFSHKAVN